MAKNAKDQGQLTAAILFSVHMRRKKSLFQGAN